MDFTSIEKQALRNIQQASSLEKLDLISQKYLGREGVLAKIFNSFGSLSTKEKKKRGKEANRLKNLLEEKITKKEKELEKELKKKKERKKYFDITIPGKKPKRGHLHPLTEVKRQIEEIFQGMGFSIVEGPEIETEWYNFDAVNMPKNHPSRDMQDTFWLKRKGKEGNLLMRTQTTSVQVRYMEKNTPPFRIIAPGKVYRYEATDASHEVHFHQFEGLLVNKEVSIANLKAVLGTFLERFFGREIEFRWRPSYFPYVEPGLEIDITCSICKGRGCPVCGKTGWVEVLGAGMIHPFVFKSAGYASEEWTGFAFGVGIERLAMIKYKINDIRLFYSNDLRFLNQF